MMRSKKEIISALLEKLRSIFTNIQSAKIPLVRLTQKEKHQINHKKSNRKSKRKLKYAQQFYAKKKGHNPKFTVPKVTIPKVTIPKVTIPKVTIPKITIPKIEITRLIPAKFNFAQLHSRTGIVVAAALALVVLAGGLVVANTEKKAFAVILNGKQIALVENRQEAEKALADLKADKAKTWNRSVEIKESVTYRETEARLYKIDSASDLTEILDDKITFVAAATGIRVNGKVSLLVKDVETAEDILKRLKESFVKDGMDIGSVKFEETVEIVQVPADLKEILEPDKALEVIKNGRQKKVVHVVSEGDSLWMIARKNDMRVAELKAANPDLKGEKLSLGQELNLVKLEPLINVLTEARVTLNETVPYDVVVEKSSSMWRGRQKIKQKGENGSREVTYKLVLKNGAEVSKAVLAEKVLKQPKNQVVVKGSRMVVASRGGGGLVGWPTGGKITSGYGRRWGRMHTGIDIDGHTGQAIGAAADGRVISTGWDGAYGKAVVISHGGGLVTKYAHLSKIEVEVGQKVSRGDLIGLMGNTGRSTGSHLHFEVIVNGSFQNPMRYLR
ncbi:MAG: peptidoglycan DD-metalloendopeptidase family protein [Bacillota bacterium]